jgi:3-phenylpropionate/trans-cinnamate dioxygenase ferredoxin reductase subunit
VFAQIHREHGVDLRTGEKVESVAETADGQLVETSRGGRIECETVVVGVGIEPNVELVRGSGVQIDDGILVDQYCQTAVEGIFAAGDVARTTIRSSVATSGWSTTTTPSSRAPWPARTCTA